MDLDQFRYYTAWHHHVNQRRYEAPGDPWAHVRVPPSAIDYCCSLRLDVGLGRVQGGDWDRDRTELRETTTYRGLVQRFVDGRDWEETALYRRARDSFDSGAEQYRGYGSLEAFREKRLTYIDDLYGLIDTEGYRSNASSEHDNPHAATNEFEDAYANHLDPLVAIARDGEVYWVEGYHRLIVAGILGVEEIPVYVLCRHEEWQHVRDRIARVGADSLPERLAVHLDHPDIRRLR